MCSMALQASKRSRSRTASTVATPYSPCSAMPPGAGIFPYKEAADDHHHISSSGVSDARTAIELLLDGMLPSTSSWRTRRLEQRAHNSNKMHKADQLPEIAPEPRAVQDPYASALLRLPPELRIAILEYLIPPPPKVFKIYTDCDPAIASKRWDRNRDTSRPRRSSSSPRLIHHQSYRGSRRNPSAIHSSCFDHDSLAILRVSRLIYYESLPLLYAKTTFHFIGSNFLPILDFFRALSPLARECVRQIKVTMLADGRVLKRTHLDMFSHVMQELIPGLNFLDLHPVIMSPALEASAGLGYTK